MHSFPLYLWIFQVCRSRIEAATFIRAKQLSIWNSLRTKTRIVFPISAAATTPTENVRTIILAQPVQAEHILLLRTKNTAETYML